MKRTQLLICALLIGCLSAARAALLWNVPQTLTQPDGAIVHCFASGDEFNHWLHDANNYTIIRNPETGYFVYALLVNDRMVPSACIAGRSDPAAAGLRPGIHVSVQQMNARRDAFVSMTASQPVRAPSAGTLNNIVIFIRFSDESEFADPLSTYNGYFNTSTAGANSVLNYFSEASYGQLTVSTTFYPIPGGATVVSFQDAHPRMYYKKYSSTDTLGYTTDSAATSREHTLLAAAVNGVKAGIPAGLTVDSDNDGYVDNVCFVVSGGAEGWSDLLWPHMWVLYTKNVSINSRRVWTYNFQLRNSLLSGGVGVLCHEMFHSLGSPDLYHYSFDGRSPVSKWDIMERDLNPPQHMGAYMKHRYGGWISSIPVINAPGSYTLSPLTSATNNCYRIPSPNSPEEFFIVEYRRKSGTFEGSLPAEGLLVYRIDSVLSGNAGGPPDEVYIYRPGGTPTVNGKPDSAIYSSNAGRTEISDATSPSCFLQNGSPGGITISNVSALGATISFTLGNARPAVSTGARTVTATTAMLSGTVNPAGLSITCHFEYGTTTVYGDSTAAEALPPGTSDVPVEALVSGLVAETEYHARLVATSAVGTTRGADFAFWTSPPGWTQQLLAGAYGIYSVKAVDSTTAWSVGAHATVIRTTDGGQTWPPANASFPSANDLYAVEALSGNFALTTATTTSTFVHRTTDGGQSWTTPYSLSAGFIDAMRMIDGSVGIAVGDPVGGKWVILKTTDAGQTWGRIATEPAQSGSEAGWNNSLAVFGGNRFWFGTNNGRVYRTTDGGVTWSWGPTPHRNSLALWFSDSLNGFAGGDSAASRTTDGGATWTAITLPGGPLHFTSLGGAGVNDVWAGTAPPASTIFRSTDSGGSWNVAYALKNGYPTHLAVTSSGSKAIIWAGTSAGAMLRGDAFLSGPDAVAGASTLVPHEFALNQNYPNPFNPSTVISYSIPPMAGRDLASGTAAGGQLSAASKVRLVVYDILGREVEVLVDESRGPGSHEVRFDASSLASGIYFYRLVAGPYVATRHMVLLR